MGSHKCQKCNSINLNINSGWAEWSTYSPCSVTCGVGVRERTRSCKTPPHIGWCLGSDHQSIKCQSNRCKKGEWTEWTIVSFCNASCGPGVRKRQRHCLTRDCVGEEVDFQHCLQRDCQSSVALVTLVVVTSIAVVTFLVVTSLIMYWRVKNPKGLIKGHQSAGAPTVTLRQSNPRVNLILTNGQEVEEDGCYDNLGHEDGVISVQWCQLPGQENFWK